MMSTSEPTFSSASAASERFSCILISFSMSSIASLHEVHEPTQRQVLGQGKAHHAGSLSECQNEFVRSVYSMSGFRLAIPVCNAGAAAFRPLSCIAMYPEGAMPAFQLPSWVHFGAGVLLCTVSLGCLGASTSGICSPICKALQHSCLLSLRQPNDRQRNLTQCSCMLCTAPMAGHVVCMNGQPEICGLQQQPCTMQRSKQQSQQLDYDHAIAENP